MTALRPERESGADGHGGAGDQGTSYARQPYGDPGAFGEGWYGEGAYAPAEGTYPGRPGEQTYQAAGEPYAEAGESYAASREPYAGTGEPYAASREPYAGTGEPYAGAGEPYAAAQEPYGSSHGPLGSSRDPLGSSRDPLGSSRDPLLHPMYEPPADDETVALRVAGSSGAAVRPASGASPSASPAAADPPSAGRAARRKAARRRHGRHGGAARPETPGPGASRDTEAPEASQAPLSRVEARRQARARKPSAGVIASRVIGELFITTGVLMLLFVTYQLWWTNVRAHAQADKAASSLQDDWAEGKRNPGTFEPGQGFALLHIPKLDVVVPIAEGVSSKGVLDRGMVGHYGGSGPLKTAMPEDKTGNFGLAGHRNTHGEPFRYINRLSPGDAIVVETQDKYFVYKMASMLPVTSPANVSVLDPIPRGSGFTQPGRYITLTTCTPEFTSKYRLIVWGKMVEERPRSKGKPDALVN
ncbi:class E sortase [Streptomyces sp. NPDC006134]|uniref:class E sortase n=1 Tax=Streptomyces sp. NPDC006134 TaxID=3154467 RepID=UPI0033E4BE21